MLWIAPVLLSEGVGSATAMFVYVSCPLSRYPPRGGMVILDAQYTNAGRAPAERFVAEEYILDLLDSWEGYRCVAGTFERADS